MANNLSEEVKTLLADYFEACAHLYGVIPLKSFLKIYNSQNEAVSEKDFIDFLENFDFESKHYDIVGEDEVYEDVEALEIIDKDLAEEYCYILDDWDDYINIKERQSGIPYYVPSKEKLLKYKDEYYFEKTLEFIEFRAFLRNQSYLTKKKADDIAEDAISFLSLGDDTIGDVISDAVRMGLNIKNKSEKDEFFRLLYELDKNVRKHIYGGHTYNELRRIIPFFR